MTQKRTIVILTALVILCTALIFSFSLRSMEESEKDSDFVADFVKPVIEKIFGYVPENLGFIIRKLAHMTEFCILSVLTALLSVKIYKYKNEALFGYALFYVLAVAVTDEFIQYFSGRGSSVVDVVIDFSGAAVGFAVIFLIYYLIPKLNAKHFSKADE